MEYEEISKKFDRNLSLKSRISETDKIKGLLSVVLYSGDYDLSLEKAIEFSKSNNEWVRGCAIECFSHIARIHGKIELEKITPIIKKNICNESLIVRGKINDTIDDLSIYLKTHRSIFL